MVGLQRVGKPHVKHLTDPLWEMHFSGRAGIARVLDVTATGREIELALRCAQEVSQ